MGRSILNADYFDLDTLTLLHRAFDETWQRIEGNYQTQAEIEDRRNRLTSIIVGLADGGVRDLSQIKEVATLLMMHANEPKQLNRSQSDAQAPSNSPVCEATSESEFRTLHK